MFVVLWVMCGGAILMLTWWLTVVRKFKGGMRSRVRIDRQQQTGSSVIAQEEGGTFKGTAFINSTLWLRGLSGGRACLVVTADILCLSTSRAEVRLARNDAEGVLVNILWGAGIRFLHDVPGLPAYVILFLRREDQDRLASVLISLGYTVSRTGR